jgi:ankyrin repeat protein/pimeloyl-ACP methyl ester carboxylesterase
MMYPSVFCVSEEVETKLSPRTLREQTRNKVTLKIQITDRAFATTFSLSLPSDLTVGELKFKILETNKMMTYQQWYGLYSDATLLTDDLKLYELPHQFERHISLSLLPDVSLHVVVSVQPTNMMERLSGSKELTSLDNEGRNLLHIYALSNSPTVDGSLLRFLHLKKISFSSVDSNGFTPLFYAIQTLKTEMILFCLKRSPSSFAIPDRFNCLPIHTLCGKLMATEEKINLIKRICNVSPFHHSDLNGNLPIHHAVLADDITTVTFFIEQYRIDVDTRNTLRLQTPLHFSVKSQSVSLTSSLLKMHASRYTLNMDGNFPIDIAYDTGNEDIIQLVSVPLTKEMISATKENSVEVFDEKLKIHLEEIIKNGGNPNEEITKCLFLCAFRQNILIRDHLLHHWSSSLIPHYLLEGTLPFCYALLHNFRPTDDTNDVLRTSLKGDAKFYRSPNHRTLLQMAILSTNEAAVRLLIANGAYLNQSDIYGMTELHFAVFSGHRRIAQDLLNAGCDATMRCRSGRTPMDLAELMGKKEILDIFQFHLGIIPITTDHRLRHVNAVMVSDVRVMLISPPKEETLYYVLHHKLNGKHKKWETENVKWYEINKKCEEIYRKNTQTKSLNHILIEACRDGNLNMVKFLIQHYDANPYCEYDPQKEPTEEKEENSESQQTVREEKRRIRPISELSIDIDSILFDPNDFSNSNIGNQSKNESRDTPRSSGSSILPTTQSNLSRNQSLPWSPPIILRNKVVSFNEEKPQYNRRCLTRSNNFDANEIKKEKKNEENERTFFNTTWTPLPPSTSYIQKEYSLLPPKRTNLLAFQRNLTFEANVSPRQHSQRSRLTHTNNKTQSKDNRVTSPIHNPITSDENNIENDTEISNEKRFSPPALSHSIKLSPPQNTTDQNRFSVSHSPLSFLTQSRISTKSKRVVLKGAQIPCVIRKRIGNETSKKDNTPTDTSKSKKMNFLLTSDGVIQGNPNRLTTKSEQPSNSLQSSFSPTNMKKMAHKLDKITKGDTAWSVARLNQRDAILEYFDNLKVKSGAKDTKKLNLDYLVFNPTHKTLPTPPTVAAEFEMTNYLLLKKSNVFFREVQITVYVHNPKIPSELHHLIGRATLLLDFATPHRTYLLTLSNPDGPVGELEVSLNFHEMSDEFLFKLELEYYPIDPFEETKKIKKAGGCKKIGDARWALGTRPKFPILIVPGLASSALEVMMTKEQELKMGRVWIDPFKIGMPAVLEKVAQVFVGGKESTTQSDDIDPDSTQEKDSIEKRRKWIEHMTLSNDGFSDPPGIKVRAVQGLHGIDYLATVSMARTASYVFAYLIRTLLEVGYDDSTLDAAPYDWRLPPHKLQERDYYFGRMKKKIEIMYEQHHKPVVLLAHSMGNRVVQYFLKWLVSTGQSEWIDTHVHAYLAMGAPFLGSSKSIRTVLFGESMGLEMFLTKDESLYMARISASLPWLYPIQESHYPDEIIRVSSDPTLTTNTPTIAPYTPTPFTSLLQSYVPRSLKFYEDFYVRNPLVLCPSHANGIPPVLEPPPVKRVWVVNGINRQTEIGYYLRGKKLDLDTTADRFSGKKFAEINPRGLLIENGIAYETNDTYQPSVKTYKSGDGTIPYCSLNYAAAEWADDVHVYTVEVDGAEHREMLHHDAVFNEILNLVCGTMEDGDESGIGNSKVNGNENGGDGF